MNRALFFRTIMLLSILISPTLFGWQTPMEKDPIPIILEEDQTARPRTIILEKVTAGYDDEFVYVEIDNYSGFASCMVLDNFGNVVAGQSAQMRGYKLFEIPVDALTSGTYELKIVAGGAYSGNIYL